MNGLNYCEYDGNFYSLRQTKSALHIFYYIYIFFYWMGGFEKVDKNRDYPKFSFFIGIYF